MNTNPYWLSPDVLPRFPKLGSNLRADVVVVGGGIAGITAGSTSTCRRTAPTGAR